MLFGKFYIKNYLANYNSYFPPESQGPYWKYIFIHAFRVSVSHYIKREKISYFLKFNS